MLRGRSSGSLTVLQFGVYVAVGEGPLARVLQFGGLRGSGGRSPRLRSALWGLPGSAGRSPRPRLCSDPLSPTPAALAGTHADVDSGPQPLGHPPATLAGTHADVDSGPRVYLAVREGPLACVCTRTHCLRHPQPWPGHTLMWTQVPGLSATSPLVWQLTRIWAEGQG